MDTNVCCLCGESMLHCGEYARPNQCPHKFHSMCLQSYVQLMQHSTDCKQCPMEVCKKTYQDILVVDAETHNVKRVVPVRPSPSSQTKDSSPPVKRQRVQSSSSNSLTQTQAECPICTNVLAGEVARPECCDHQFCVSCLLKWAERTHTCPMDRGAFELIFIFTDHVNGVIKKRMKAPPVKKSEEEMEAERLAAEADDIVCRICRRGDNEESLMLCDTCQDAYHIYCLSPPLSRVPDDDWHCDDCAPPSRRPSRLQVAANANRRRRGTVTVATRRRRRPSVDLVSLPSSADDETDSDASQFLVTRSRSRSADALRTRTVAVRRERRPNRPGPSSSRPRRVEPLSDQDSESDSSDEEDGDETEGEERNSFIDDECEEGEEEIDGSESSGSDDEDEEDELDSEADLFLEEAPCSSNYRPRSASAGVVRKRSSRSATSRPKKRRRKTSRPATKRKSRKSSSRKTTKKGTKRKKRSTSRRKKGRKTSRTKSRGVSRGLRSSLVLPTGGGEPVVGGSRLDVFGRGANGSGLLDSFPHEEMSSENGRMRARRFLLELDSSGDGTTVATGPPTRARPPSPNVSFLSGIVAAQNLTYSRHLVADSSTGVLRRVDDCIGGPSKPPTSAPAVPDIRNLGSDKPSSSSTFSTSAPPRANPVPRRTLLILDSDSDSGPASPPHSLLRVQTASATCTTANENRPPPSMHTSHTVTAGPPQWLSSKRSFKHSETAATTTAKSSKTVNEQSASSSSLSKNCELPGWVASNSLTATMTTSRPVSKPSEEAEPSSVKRPSKQSEASAINGSTAARSSKTVNEQSASSSSLSKNCEPHSWAVSKSLSTPMTTSCPVSKPSQEAEPSSVKRPSKQSEASAANGSTTERSSKTVNEQSASLLSLIKSCEPPSRAVSKSLSSTSRTVSKPSEEAEPSFVKRPSKQSEAPATNGSTAARSSNMLNEQSASSLYLSKNCEPPGWAVSTMTSSCPVLKHSKEAEPSSFKFVSSSQSLNKPSQSTSFSSIFIGSASTARTSNGVASQLSSSRLATEPIAPAMNGQNIQKNAGRDLLSSQANNHNSDAISQDSQRTTLGIEEESPYFPVPLQTVSRVSSGNLVSNVMSVSSEKSSNFDNRRLHKEEASVCVRYALEKYVVQGQVPEDCVLKLHSRILEKIFKKITSLKKASIESYVKKYVDHWLIMRSCVAGNS